MNRDREEYGVYARTTDQERNRTTRASQETETAPATAASDRSVAASIPGSTATMPKGRGGSLLLGGWDVTKQTSLKNAAGQEAPGVGRDGRCRGDGKLGTGGLGWGSGARAGIKRWVWIGD